MSTDILNGRSPNVTSIGCRAGGIVRFMMLAVLALLSGCGSGGGEGSGGGGGGGAGGGGGPGAPSGPAEIRGVWSGTATLSTGGPPRSAVLIADDAGDALLYVANGASSFTLRGDACCEALVEGVADGWWLYDRMSARVPVRFLASDLAFGGRAISGEVTVDNIEYTLSLRLLEDYSDPLTFPALAGEYTRTASLSGTTFRFIISETGSLSGGEGENGCQYNGQIRIPDTSRNLFRIERLELSNCPQQALIRNGIYTGLGHLYDSEDGTDDTLLFLATGPVSWALLLPVKDPPLPPIQPQISLNVLSDLVEYAGVTRLAWSAQNASSCTASNGWAGSRSPAGGQELTPAITANTTFDLTCVGEDGASSTASVAVSVKPLPPEVSAGVGNDTLAGIDSNTNGVRDDVERHLLTEYPAGPERTLLLELARDLGAAISAPMSTASAQQASRDLFEELECLGHTNIDGGVQSAGELLARLLNTPDRVRAYLELNALSGGQVFELRSSEELEGACGSFEPLVATQTAAVRKMESRSSSRKPLSATDPVALIHVNGVLTDIVGLNKNVRALERALLSTTAPDLNVTAIHNQTEGALFDLFEAALQSDIQSSDFVRMLLGIREWTSAFESAFVTISDVASVQNILVSTVVNSIVTRVTQLHESHARVILVPHSQGNFFVNAAHRELSPQAQRCTWVVGIASPDVPVSHATYEYVTLSNDRIIFLARQARSLAGLQTALPTTETEFLNSPSPFNSLGHALDLAYLISGTASRNEILTYITNARYAPRPAGSPCEVPEDPLPSGVGPRWTFVLAEAAAEAFGQATCTEALLNCDPWYFGLRDVVRSTSSSGRLNVMRGDFNANLYYSSTIGYRSLSFKLDGLLKTISRPAQQDYYPFGEARGTVSMQWNLNATGFHNNPDRTPMQSFQFILSGSSSSELSTSPERLPLMDTEDGFTGIPLCPAPQIRLTNVNSGSTITLGGIFGNETREGSITTGQYVVTVTAAGEQLKLVSGTIDDDAISGLPEREMTCRLQANFRIAVMPPAP